MKMPTAGFRCTVVPIECLEVVIVYLEVVMEC